MDVNPLIPKGHQLVEAYGDGGFKITGSSYDGPVIVFPTHTVAWDVTRFDAVTLDALRPVLEAEEPVELLLVGCGEHFGQLPRALRDGLKARGISVEAMDTGAACRTYNILMAEGRKVAAALIAV